ncbi:MAG TPA: SDR family oxidoreductase [Gemmatimonadaceae bacterium]|nr:SDR family oxidoreductase [Gemmatimonadaceae bacterium]
MTTARSILVTGATGLIGRRVVASLLHLTDAPIVVLVRDPARWSSLATRLGAAASRVTAVRADITLPTLGLDLRTIARGLGAPSVLVHCAGDIIFSRSLDESRRVNVEGTRNVVELASSFSDVRLVQVSTAFAVGRRTGFIPEGASAAGEGWVNAYEQSKHEAEALVRDSGVEYTIARPSTVVCDDVGGAVTQVNAVHRALRLYHAGLASMMPGTEDTPVDVIPADWVAEAIAKLSLAGNCAGKTIHLCAGAGALPLGALLDRTYALWSRDTSWRRRHVARPALSDLDTYGLFERSVELVGDARLKRITRSLSHFVPQLALPKVFDTSLSSELLGQTAPAVTAYWDRMLEWLLASNWSTALPEAA